MNTLREHTNNEEVRGLSINQPYAQLMLHGKVEVRTWSTPYRGWVLISSTKGGYKDAEVRELSGKHYKGIDDIMMGRALRSGMCLFTGKLVDCRLLEPEDYDSTYLEIGDDLKKPLYGHFYKDVVRVQQVPVTGKLGYYKLSSDLLDSIVLV